MSKHIQNLGKNEWRVAHSHTLSTYLNESEELLYKWRSDVEAQGCQLINTVVFRDPLNHAMSLWKIIDHKNASTEEWLGYLESPTGTGKWATVLDFFLYNIHGLRHRDDYPNGPGGRNPFSVTKEAKVKRAMELLHRHFDIVTVDHETFARELLHLTGWPRKRMLYRNRYLKELTYTKSEIETLQKLLQMNGDYEFIDRVKYEYHDYLSYMDDLADNRGDRGGKKYLPICEACNDDGADLHARKGAKTNQLKKATGKRKKRSAKRAAVQTKQAKMS